MRGHADYQDLRLTGTRPAVADYRPTNTKEVMIEG